VKDLTFTAGANDVIGIVGESGSGKTLTAYAIAGLLPRGVSIRSGDIRLEGRSLLELDDSQRRALGGRRIGVVLQERLSAFNPVRTIGSLLIESARRHRGLSTAQARQLAIDALAHAHLADSQLLVDAYPHQLSGGQLQRAMIALAGLNEPVLLIADEPTSALDPSVRQQILALLAARAQNRALVLITHDLGIAAAMGDRLVVMQRGECVEQGRTADILSRPRHPYTQQLLAAVQSLASFEASPLRSVSNL
jgi:ABC-type glutathione transport system ATPase component